MNTLNQNQRMIRAVDQWLDPAALPPLYPEEAVWLDRVRAQGLVPAPDRIRQFIQPENYVGNLSFWEETNRKANEFLHKILFACQVQAFRHVSMHQARQLRLASPPAWLRVVRSVACGTAETLDNYALLSQADERSPGVHALAVLLRGATYTVCVGGALLLQKQSHFYYALDAWGSNVVAQYRPECHPKALTDLRRARYTLGVWQRRELQKQMHVDPLLKALWSTWGAAFQTAQEQEWDQHFSQVQQA